MISFSKSIAPDLAVSIGWSSAPNALELLEYVDVVSFHDYDRIGGLPDRLAQIRGAADGKPVIISEIGNTSYTLAMNYPGSPEKQAENLRIRLAASVDADGVLIWTLYDFTKVDSSAIGSSPWAQRLQASYGLYSGDGVEKPAAGVVRSAFSDLP